MRGIYRQTKTSDVSRYFKQFLKSESINALLAAFRGLLVRGNLINDTVGQAQKLELVTDMDLSTNLV